ncbi:MAG TPA: hypothetical protein VM286_00385 [Candidatus Thermoplasmatota archaeon]|nr:hypothetical protein [Candidatus Thermoplasmatota archaeon]
MAPRRATLLAAAALLAPLLAGCLDPYRAHVDEATLAAAKLSWTREDHPQTDGGLFGVKSMETDYTHSGSGPPFPGHVLVFSLRTAARPSTEQLLQFTRTAVDNSTASNGIRIDRTLSATGTRTLASGLQTQYFTEEGTSTAGGLFAVNTKVRILGEVGYDGRSSTSIVAVGLAQVESSRTCPLGINCGTTTDLATWNEIVGDPGGSVGGAQSATGLLHHLVSHG